MNKFENLQDAVTFHVATLAGKNDENYDDIRLVVDIRNIFWKLHDCKELSFMNQYRRGDRFEKFLADFLTLSMIPRLMKKAPDAKGLYRKYQSYEANIPVSGAIVFNPTLTKVLIVEQFGVYCFPRGKRDQGEEGVTTAIREVMEETSVDITPYISPNEYINVTTRSGKNIQLYIVIYPGQVTPKPQAMEIQSAGWIPVDVIPFYKEHLLSQFAVALLSWAMAHTADPHANQECNLAIKIGHDTYHDILKRYAPVCTGLLCASLYSVDPWHLRHEVSYGPNSEHKFTNASRFRHPKHAKFVDGCPVPYEKETSGASAHRNRPQLSGPRTPSHVIDPITHIFEKFDENRHVDTKAYHKDAKLLSFNDVHDEDGNDGRYEWNPNDRSSMQIIGNTFVRDVNNDPEFNELFGNKMHLHPHHHHQQQQQQQQQHQQRRRQQAQSNHSTPSNAFPPHTHNRNDEYRQFHTINDGQPGAHYNEASMMPGTITMRPSSLFSEEGVFRLDNHGQNAAGGGPHPQSQSHHPQSRHPQSNSNPIGFSERHHTNNHSATTIPVEDLFITSPHESHGQPVYQHSHPHQSHITPQHQHQQQQQHQHQQQHQQQQQQQQQHPQQHQHQHQHPPMSSTVPRNPSATTRIPAHIPPPPPPPPPGSMGPTTPGRHQMNNDKLSRLRQMVRQ